MSQTERIFTLDRWLRERPPVTVREVCERFEVSANTVKGDIEYMRSRLHAPIVYVRTPRSGYVYASDGEAFALPPFWLDPTELYALVALRALLQTLTTSWRGASLEPAARTVDALIMHSTPDQGGGLTRRVRVSPFEHRDEAPTCFGLVAGALFRDRQLRVRYWSRSSDTRSERVVSPLRLLHHRHGWYLFAWCHTRLATRTFHLDAIEHALLLDLPAAAPLDDEEIERRIHVGFGIFVDSDGEVATLRFAPRAARWVRSWRWHPEQRLEPEADGSILVHVPYGDDTELLQVILQHGPDVEVVGPPALRAKVVARIRETLGRYGEG